MKKKIELLTFTNMVARAGKHISQEKIEAIAALYNPETYESAIQVRHENEKDDEKRKVADREAAYGWVTRLWIEGNALYAEMAIHPDLAKLIEEKKIRNVSIAWYEDFEDTGRPYLLHIAFLGVTPPKIKGMEPLKLSSSTGEIKTTLADAIDLTEEKMELSGDHGRIFWLFRSFGGVLRSMREFLIEKYGVEMASKVIPDWIIGEVEEARAQDEEKQEKNEFSQEVNTMGDDKKGTGSNINLLSEPQYTALITAAVEKKETELNAIHTTEKKALSDELDKLKDEFKGLQEKVGAAEKKVLSEKVDGHITFLIENCLIEPSEKQELSEAYNGYTEQQLTAAIKMDKRRTPVMELGEEPAAKGEPKKKMLSEIKLNEDEAFALEGLTEDDFKKYGGGE